MAHDKKNTAARIQKSLTTTIRRPSKARIRTGPAEKVGKEAGGNAGSKGQNRRAGVSGSARKAALDSVP